MTLGHGVIFVTLVCKMCVSDYISCRLVITTNAKVGALNKTGLLQLTAVLAQLIIDLQLSCDDRQTRLASTSFPYV